MICRLPPLHLLRSMPTILLLLRAAHLRAIPLTHHHTPDYHQDLTWARLQCHLPLTTLLEYFTTIAAQNLIFPLERHLIEDIPRDADEKVKLLRLRPWLVRPD